MEYVREININEAVIHILDSNSEEVIINEYPLELNDEIYAFLMKHVQKCLNDEELRYAVFNQGRGILKEISQEYLNGENNLIEVSKELARQMFQLIKANGNIPSCDLIVISLSTEFGVMLGILKMDYVKNYTHNINFVENKIGINIIPQFTGLPNGGQKIQKCAFIKPSREENDFDLMVIDKQNKGKENDDYGTNYFISSFLGCSIINNERDMTKGLLKAAEKWTRDNYKEDADTAEVIRSAIKKRLKSEENIEIQGFTEDIFKDQVEAQKNFMEYISGQGVENNISVDKEWLDKRLKRVRLKIDKDIDLYINEETYDDINRFEIVRNGDGTINMIIKHVSNYIEK
ncbi:MAG: nucleoid-associated protein [Clostridiaceae bacterium]|nr:nucleoid-associated protein [Clostridiaceae bacterium]